MDQIPLYVTGLAAEAEGQLLSALDDLPIHKVDAEPRALAEPGKPAIAVVGLNGDPEAAFRSVTGLAAGGVRVAVVGDSKDADLILRAMRSGAREFVVAGEPERLEVAVRALVRPGMARTTSTVTAFFPAKGGMGATTIAANAAAAAAARGARACLVDLELQLGDALSLLDLQSAYTVSDVLANLRRLDRELLDSSVAKHRAGMSVLAQGERLDEADKIDAAAIGQLVGFLRQHYGHVLLDGLHGFDELSLAALDAADRVVLLVTQEVPAVRNAQRAVGIFRKLGYEDSKLLLVLNRYQPRSNVTREVITETVGLPVAATVANDFPLLANAVGRGATLAEVGPRAAITRDVEALASLLGAEDDSGATRRSWWRRLLGGAHGSR
ncbi:AAA family ATPase [Anaeromyxobacter sp. Fw109-5]|uniref:AAA family ATPase n=1 Tax=Anaeromyxobacter sp. (strain Fw109-5) TaxID=404589 RepID=UPI0000ED6EAD|nr:AAA family ATPase [Anaeromyxobacter sp. Fw109-5]ABS28145.1 Flp pilus assembly protein ATPase CpaE-like protein [Anaeromyxobacter sp. Fw109-5]